MQEQVDGRLQEVVGCESGGESEEAWLAGDFERQREVN